MIDIEATIKEFGYNPDDLKPQSHKKVICICDECGKERVVDLKSYRNLCMSCSKMGNKNSLNKNLGNKHRLNKFHTEDTKKKMSDAQTGEKNHKWKGGPRATYRRYHLKRRLFFDPDPIELNKDFEDSEGHHIDKKFIINIPYNLHHSIFHRQFDGLGMKEINKEAFKYLYNHKEELMMPEQEVFNINLGVG